MADKVWRKLRPEKMIAARCMGKRLMWQAGLRGGVRSQVVCATIADTIAPCPLKRVNRQSKAWRTNQLWVIDFTSSPRGKALPIPARLLLTGLQEIRSD